MKAKEMLLGLLIGWAILAIFSVISERYIDHVITIPGKTFDLDVVVVIESDLNKAYKVVKKIDTTATIADFDARGVTFVNGSSIVVWMPKADDQIVAHELLHANFAIMNWAGVKLNDDTEEVYAYNLQYLTKEFYKQLNR